MSPIVAVPSARVRMYRQGLGDCFLLSLSRADGPPFHALIDCGVLLGTTDAGSVMKRVAADVEAETNGHLDVVIATHEHWDHLSGFIQARDVFDRIEIDEVWMAWTEDPTDKLAAHLRRKRDQALKSLRAATSRLAATNPEAAKRVRGTLGFFRAAAGRSCRDALDYLANHPSQPRVHFHRPSDRPLELGDGQRVYVLGPPQDEALIRRSNPTKSGHETYEFALFAAGALAASDSFAADGAQAFESRFRVPTDQAGGMPFFQRSYYRGTDKWRRIDGDWLLAAEGLALALDNHTNNTSLALAFELEPGGRVLLFPGDAQVGNWLSWNSCQWRVAPPPAPWETVANLLRRTVLYKVGHHGSHNATLRELGLERMTSQELVALIPVDRMMAERKRWKMPFPSLYARLLTLCRGRVLRADDVLPVRPEGVGRGEWQAFLDRVASGGDNLYYDYTVGPIPSHSSFPR